MGWTRKLDPDWEPNPNNIPDEDPDYEIHILHVLPKVPKGSTQMWQIVKCTNTRIDKECKKTEKAVWFRDVVKIGPRKEIPDLLSLELKKEKYCFVMEKCEHTVGFDDGKTLDRVSSEEIDEDTGNAVIKRMQSKDTFTTDYAWRSDDEKCNKCEKVTDPFGLDPGEEALRVPGAGEFLPKRLQKKKEEEEKAKTKSEGKKP